MFTLNRTGRHRSSWRTVAQSTGSMGITNLNRDSGALDGGIGLFLRVIGEDHNYVLLMDAKDALRVRKWIDQHLQGNSENPELVFVGPAQFDHGDHDAAQRAPGDDNELSEPTDAELMERWD